MSALPLLQSFEQLPLLGSGLAHARALDEELLRALLRFPDAHHQLRALLRRGELQLALGEEQAPATLADAARRAGALGELRTELHARLLLVRALAELGSTGDALALLPRAEREAAAEPTLRLPRALARAALDQDGALAELRAALEEPTRPGDEAAVLAAQLRAAEALADTARGGQADALYIQAEALCAGLGEHELGRSVSLQRACGLLRHGQPQAALPALHRAAQAEDTRVALAAGLLLGGLLLSLGRPQEALPVLTRGQALAEARRSWLAFASASLDLAEALRGVGQPEAAERTLVAALASCRAQGEPGVLLQARLLELRQGAPADSTPEEFRVYSSESLEEEPPEEV